MENKTSKKQTAMRDFAKTVEIAVLCSLLPYLIHDFTTLRRPAAYGIGVFVGAVLAYWLPPTARLSFAKWVAVSAVGAIFIYGFTTVVG
jgi:hypothetical protein